MRRKIILPFAFLVIILPIALASSPAKVVVMPALAALSGRNLPAGPGVTPGQSGETVPDLIPHSGTNFQRAIPWRSVSTPAVSSPAVETTASQPTAKAVRLPPEQWKDWPVYPDGISEALKQTYKNGLAQGNDPHAFSILGDCQSQPEVFLGIYDSDPVFVSGLSPALQETVVQFAGSFNRYSPTVKDGTTEGALLWAQWNDNKDKTCTNGETPLDCELRVHRPGIVFLHVGTHWEARNRRYLTTIIDKLLDHNAVPILVTKADNREHDERVNQNLASLAAEYNLPLWNFWASVQHLPENGMRHGSDMYLSDAGLEIHRQGALETLDLVWRALRD